MNEIIETKNRPTLDSREVADMMEINHSDLLKKLEGTNKITGIIPTLNKGNFTLVDYFIETSYKDAKGEERKCYLFTKMGCEFIANKFTGEKGILFTAKYVKRFNDMESVIMPNMSKELQAILMIDQKQQVIESRMENLENNMTIDYGQQKNINSTARKRVLNIIGGADKPAYVNRSVSLKIFAALWRDYKDYFNVNSYFNTAKFDYQKAIGFISEWKPQGKLMREIEDCNNQICI